MKVLATACVIVGITLALYGTIADRTPAFRVGVLTLLVSSAVALHLTSRANAAAVMAHQTQVARLTVQERQQYAEMGWKAARLDALTGQAPEIEGGAEVVILPRTHSPQMRRDGSA
ncbi:hypothetical protein ACIGZH_01955 [Streptomyces sp. NPDC058319]|uniref:hypothetical protein n=1 Tax=unclassified Streptomyces TaxID=2593676 RepID=UPI0036EF9D01